MLNILAKLHKIIDLETGVYLQNSACELFSGKKCIFAVGLTNAR